MEIKIVREIMNGRIFCHLKQWVSLVFIKGWCNVKTHMELYDRYE